MIPMEPEFFAALPTIEQERIVLSDSAAFLFSLSFEVGLEGARILCNASNYLRAQFEATFEGAA